jgi:hypothetical protein
VILPSAGDAELIHFDPATASSERLAVDCFPAPRGDRRLQRDANG